ncbi:MAG: glycosyltransferase [Pseudomonadota bacterium]
MKNKKTILLFIFFLAFLVNIKPIKKFFRDEEFHSILVDLGVVRSKCYGPYNSDDFANFFSSSGLNYEKADQEVTSSSLNKLDNLENIENKFSIALISHHVYFTPKENPSVLPDIYYEKMKVNFAKLNELDTSWQHFIWTNNPNLFPDDVKNFKNVVIKDISSFKDHPLYNYLQSRIDKGNKRRAYFMEGSDMVRLMALQKFGGIYTDIDYEIYDAVKLLEFMKKFDFIGGREFRRIENSYYGNAFILAKQNHPIINEAVRRLELYNLDPNNSLVPYYIKYPCSFFEKLYFNSPPLLTLSYFLKSNIDGNNDIILPSWMVYNMEFARLKNGQCRKFISKEEFLDKNKILNELLAKYASEFNEETGSSLFKSDIYYSIENKEQYPIIGADMFCGTWSHRLKNPKFYYWNSPFDKWFKTDEN